MAFQVTSSQHKYIIVCCMKLLHALLKVMTILSLLTQEKKIKDLNNTLGTILKQRTEVNSNYTIKKYTSRDIYIYILIN